ncbi:hypothetical protein GUJ93_ZPchr0012g20571 [Zizania palustris]|uniref:Uncharacterized protein n=1 Tax=Zizania palustris TaxID=103762 RepID=A0A8J6BQ17_ZIZPA|nr:hypothetical protein GUJ93_ZPchr0012g20571 [Zizania palustris]
MVMRERHKGYVPTVLLTLYGASPDRKLLGGTRAPERPCPGRALEAKPTLEPCTVHTASTLRSSARARSAPEISMTHVASVIRPSARA